MKCSQNPNLRNTTRSFQARSGFALISVISLVVLLALVAIALLTLGNVSTRGSESDTAEAQQNAKLALTLALNELQESTGPDTRITAPADSFAGSTDDNDLEQSPLVGVFDSWRGEDYVGKMINDGPDTATPPDYASKSTTKFRRWLISGDSSSGTADMTVGGTPPVITGGPVTLLGDGTLGDSPDSSLTVAITPTPINASSNSTEQTGSYAWWIQGNNTKALVQHDPHTPGASSTPDSPEERSQRQASYSFGDPGSYGLDDSPDLNKAITQASLRLASPAEAYDGSLYHGVTTYAKGLPTNVATGGLKRDLSLFSENYEDAERAAWGSPLPSPFPTFNTTPSNQIDSELTIASGNGYLYPWASTTSTTGHYPSMSWASFADFSSLYKKIIVDADRFDGPAYEITTYLAQQDFQSPDLYTISEPIFSKLQYVFSHTAIPNPDATDKFHPAIGISPLTVYHNPYNVSLITGDTLNGSARFDLRQDLHFISAKANDTATRDGLRTPGLSIPFKIDYEFTKISEDANGAPITEDISSPTRLISFFGGREKHNAAELHSSFHVTRAIASRVTRNLRDINFTWKPGESKVIGRAERNHDSTDKFFGVDALLNDRARISSGYDLKIALLAALDENSELKKNGKRVFQDDSRILADIDKLGVGDMSGPDTMQTVTNYHDDITTPDPSNPDPPTEPITLSTRFIRNQSTSSLDPAIRNWLASERVVSAVYDRSTLSTFLPLPDSPVPRTISEVIHPEAIPFLSYSFGLKDLSR